MLATSKETGTVLPVVAATPVADAPAAEPRTRAQYFHVWLLPLLWIGPAAYVAYQHSFKMSPVMFETVMGRALRTALAYEWQDVSLVIPLVVGVFECALLGFVMDRLAIRKWIYVFLALGAWVLLEGNLPIICLLTCWTLYAMGVFSSIGGLTLQIVRRITSRATPKVA